jgi:hypothetical protein
VAVVEGGRPRLENVFYPLSNFELKQRKPRMRT